MTDKNLTEIIVISDRSGSMATLANEAISGFNKFLEDQQKDQNGQCLMTYVQFDTVYEVVYNSVDIHDAKPLTTDAFIPRGMTALLDAMGNTIESVGKRLSKTPEDKRPGNVTVVIITDGQENASQKFTHEAVKKLVKEQIEKYNWSFVYLGQNIDTFSSGRSMGMSYNSPNVYSGDAKVGSRGYIALCSVASEAVSRRRYKGVSGQSLDFTDQDKEEFTSALLDDEPQVDPT